MDSLTIHNTGKFDGGTIAVPSSKSYIHRYMLSSLLAQGESKIDNVSFSKDIEATAGCIKALGAEVTTCGTSIMVNGGTKRIDEVSLYCNESASTLRFLIPIALLFSSNVTIGGANSLMNRPLEPYFEIFDRQGIEYDFKKGESLKICGTLKSGTYELDGSVSSQFVTGLLFALPLLDGDSEINIRGTLQSAPYVDITLEVLQNSGIEIVNENYQKFYIKGNQKYVANNFFAQGDYSQAAFFLCLGCLKGKLAITNMCNSSLQGDRVVVDILKKMGGNITEVQNGFVVDKSELESIGTINAEDFPDIVPILSLACALAKGQTQICGIERLRIKECDRITATAKALSALGADIKEEGSILVINGKPSLGGGVSDSFNDHRMAMTLAIASLVCEGDVTITNPMSINKSYPRFYEDLQTTGGVEYEWNLG